MIVAFVDEHCDDLTLDRILDGLKADLRARGQAPPSDETALARLLIDTYIHFPEPTSGEPS